MKTFVSLVQQKTHQIQKQKQALSGRGKPLKEEDSDQMSVDLDAVE